MPYSESKQHATYGRTPLGLRVPAITINQHT